MLFMAWTSFIDARDVDQEVRGISKFKYIFFGHPLPQLHGFKLVHAI